MHIKRAQHFLNGISWASVNVTRAYIYHTLHIYIYIHVVRTVYNKIGCTTLVQLKGIVYSVSFAFLYCNLVWQRTERFCLILFYVWNDVQWAAVRHWHCHQPAIITQYHIHILYIHIDIHIIYICVRWEKRTVYCELKKRTISVWIQFLASLMDIFYSFSMCIKAHI